MAKQEKAPETESAKEEGPVIIVQKDDWTKDGTDVADVDEDTEIEYADRDGERFVTRDVSLSTGHHMQWIQSGFPRMSP